MGKKKSKTAENTIAQNRLARHDYFIEDELEVGMVLEGWEVKAIRSGNVQLTDSYVLLRDGEAWLLGANIGSCTCPRRRNIYRCFRRFARWPAGDPRFTNRRISGCNRSR